MKLLLFLGGLLLFVAGAIALNAAKSALHEIEAFILFLISAVMCAGAGIIEAEQRHRRESRSQGHPLGETCAGCGKVIATLQEAIYVGECMKCGRCYCQRCNPGMLRIGNTRITSVLHDCPACR